MYGIHFAGLEHGEGLLVNTVQKTDEQFAELLPAMAQTEIVGDVFLSLDPRQGQRETLDSVTAQLLLMTAGTFYSYGVHIIK